MNAYDHDYFERLYRLHGDPWAFETSTYEQAKHGATLAALPRAHYRHALELGCSIGVLTEKLAPRVSSLTAVDTSTHALDRARERLAKLSHVRLLRAHLPDGAWQEGRYDLIVLSEVLYYFDMPTLLAMGRRLKTCALPGADIVAVHWTGPTDYPLTADMATEGLEQAFDELRLVHHRHTDFYRLDVWHSLI